jgi:pimeloyl-ACP methyl ester carboxylesterase
MNKPSTFALVCTVAACSGGPSTPGVSTAAIDLPPQAACDVRPTDIERFDDFLEFTVPDGLLPDNQFAGQTAHLQVHRVRPTYAHGKCPSVRNAAVVLIHGRSISAEPTFDLRHTSDTSVSLSVQEDLARGGVETFAPSLLGYGRSSRLSLDDPCNASLRPYNADGTCSWPEGCDHSHNPINPYDQQKGLIPRPLANGRCSHSSSNLFARTDTWVRDIRQVIDFAIAAAQPSDGKVVLVGYSAGAQRVGRALYPSSYFPDNQTAVVDKVSRVAFISPLVLGPADEPNVVTTFPLVVGGSAAGGFPLSPASEEARCTGHVVPGEIDEEMRQLFDEDPIGSGWGAKGLYRFPTFNGYGFNVQTGARINLPTLVMWGLQDATLRGNIDPCTLFDAIPVESKVMLQVDCASHSLPLEGCSGERCQPGGIPAYGTSPRTPWGGPHSTLVAALLEWIFDGKFDHKDHGSFTIDASGVAQPGRRCPWL